MRTLYLFTAVSFILVSSASGQRVYFGVTGGTGLTSDFPGFDTAVPADSFGNPASHFQYLTGPRSSIVGALLEGWLSESFSVEVNALHRPMKARIIETIFPAGSVNRFTEHFTAVEAWEFPVLFKYTTRPLGSGGGVRPFVGAGPALRSQQNAGAAEPSRFGVSFEAGAAFQYGRIRIAPELRYTRWEGESIYPKYPTKPDQLEFLTSVAFETDAELRRFGGRTVELGAVVGFPLTSGFAQDSYSKAMERTRYLIGLEVQVHVAGNISVETDAIYRPLRAGSNTSNLQTPFSVLTWQFPVLGKYRWTRGRWTPFAEAGPSFRLAGNLNGYNPSHSGATLGGGLETRARGFRLSAGLRYTRWGADPPPFRAGPGAHPAYPRTNGNTLEPVFGVSF